MEFTNIEIEAKYQALHPDLKAALNSPDIYSSLQNIAEKYNLLMDKAGILEQEVTLVLLGLVPSSKFIDRLKVNLDVSVDVSEKIAADINETIFKEFREVLMEIHEKAKQIEIEKATKIIPEQPFVEDNKLDRDEILKEIERIEKFEENLVPSVGETIPDADTEVKDEPVDAKKVEEVVEEVKPVYKVDPYREPIE